MDKDKLNEILEKHKLWLAGEKGGEKADLRGANLRYANLYGANLIYANLRDVDLTSANLRYANLQYADLTYADLFNADLRYANLYKVSLTNANLEYANLRYANLKQTFLGFADLCDIELEGANLCGTDLRGVDLSDEDLRYINSLNGIKGYRVISVQMDTSRKNNLIHYWVELDIVTTGCFQGSLQELKDSVAKTHKNNDVIRKRYEKAIEFIEYMVEDYKNEKAANGN